MSQIWLTFLTPNENTTVFNEDSITAFTVIGIPMVSGTRIGKLNPPVLPHYLESVGPDFVFDILPNYLLYLLALVARNMDVSEGLLAPQSFSGTFVRRYEPRAPNKHV